MEFTTDRRKEIEIAHYEEQARKWLEDGHGERWLTDTHRLRHSIYSSYGWFEGWLRANSSSKRVLDYGCGNGIHSIAPALAGAREVIGIDLSGESLEIARRRASLHGVADRVSFTKMDCEKLDFPDRHFDLAIDGGTFSSLNLPRALPELTRVLRPDGKLIGIETLGHNPLFNLKRRINVLRGTRTRWAASHIFKMSDFALLRKYYREVEARFFHLTVMLAIPLRSVPAVPRLIRGLDRLDDLLLRTPPLRRLAFKTVFVLSGPRS
jgi:SAM-dependent methyltransferase